MFSALSGDREVRHDRQGGHLPGGTGWGDYQLHEGSGITTGKGAPVFYGPSSSGALLEDEEEDGSWTSVSGPREWTGWQQRTDNLREQVMLLKEPGDERIDPESFDALLAVLDAHLEAQQEEQAVSGLHAETIPPSCLAQLQGLCVDLHRAATLVSALPSQPSGGTQAVLLTDGLQSLLRRLWCPANPLDAQRNSSIMALFAEGMAMASFGVLTAEGESSPSSGRGEAGSDCTLSDTLVGRLADNKIAVRREALQLLCGATVAVAQGAADSRKAGRLRGGSVVPLQSSLSHSSAPFSEGFGGGAACLERVAKKIAEAVLHRNWRIRSEALGVCVALISQCPPRYLWAHSGENLRGAVAGSGWGLLSKKSSSRCSGEGGMGRDGNGGNSLSTVASTVVDALAVCATDRRDKLRAQALDCLALLRQQSGRAARARGGAEGENSYFDSAVLSALEKAAAQRSLNAEENPAGEVLGSASRPGSATTGPGLGLALSASEAFAAFELRIERTGLPSLSTEFVPVFPTLPTSSPAVAAVGTAAPLVPASLQRHHLKDSSSSSSDAASAGDAHAPFHVPGSAAHTGSSVAGVSSSPTSPVHSPGAPFTGPFDVAGKEQIPPSAVYSSDVSPPPPGQQQPSLFAVSLASGSARGGSAPAAAAAAAVADGFGLGPPGCVTARGRQHGDRGERGVERERDVSPPVALPLPTAAAPEADGNTGMGPARNAIAAKLRLLKQKRAARERGTGEKGKAPGTAPLCSTNVASSLITPHSLAASPFTSTASGAQSSTTATTATGLEGPGTLSPSSKEGGWNQWRNGEKETRTRAEEENVGTVPPHGGRGSVRASAVSSETSVVTARQLPPSHFPPSPAAPDSSLLSQGAGGDGEREDMKGAAAGPPRPRPPQMPGSYSTSASSSCAGATPAGGTAIAARSGGGSHDVGGGEKERGARQRGYRLDRAGRASDVGLADEEHQYLHQRLQLGQQQRSNTYPSAASSGFLCGGGVGDRSSHPHAGGGNGQLPVPPSLLARPSAGPANEFGGSPPEFGAASVSAPPRQGGKGVSGLCWRGELGLDFLLPLPPDTGSVSLQQQKAPNNHQMSALGGMGESEDEFDGLQHGTGGGKSFNPRQREGRHGEKRGEEDSEGKGKGKRDRQQQRLSAPPLPDDSDSSHTVGGSLSSSHICGGEELGSSLAPLASRAGCSGQPPASAHPLMHVRDRDDRGVAGVAAGGAVGAPQVVGGEPKGRRRSSLQQDEAAGRGVDFQFGRDAASGSGLKPSPGTAPVCCPPQNPRGGAPTERENLTFVDLLCSPESHSESSRPELRAAGEKGKGVSEQSEGAEERRGGRRRRSSVEGGGGALNSLLRGEWGTDGVLGPQGCDPGGVFPPPSDAATARGSGGPLSPDSSCGGVVHDSEGLDFEFESGGGWKGGKGGGKGRGARRRDRGSEGGEIEGLLAGGVSGVSVGFLCPSRDTAAPLHPPNNFPSSLHASSSSSDPRGPASIANTSGGSNSNLSGGGLNGSVGSGREPNGVTGRRRRQREGDRDRLDRDPSPARSSPTTISAASSFGDPPRDRERERERERGGPGPILTCFASPGLPSASVSSAASPTGASASFAGGTPSGSSNSGGTHQVPSAPSPSPFPALEAEVRGFNIQKGRGTLRGERGRGQREEDGGRGESTETHTVSAISGGQQSSHSGAEGAGAGAVFGRRGLPQRPRPSATSFGDPASLPLPFALSLSLGGSGGEESVRLEAVESGSSSSIAGAARGGGGGSLATCGDSSSRIAPMQSSVHGERGTQGIPEGIVGAAFPRACPSTSAAVRSVPSPSRTECASNSRGGPSGESGSTSRISGRGKSDLPVGGGGGRVREGGCRGTAAGGRGDGGGMFGADWLLLRTVDEEMETNAAVGMQSDGRDRDGEFEKKPTGGRSKGRGEVYGSDATPSGASATVSVSTAASASHVSVSGLAGTSPTATSVTSTPSFSLTSCGVSTSTSRTTGVTGGRSGRRQNSMTGCPSQSNAAFSASSQGPPSDLSMAPDGVAVLVEGIGLGGGGRQPPAVPSSSSGFSSSTSPPPSLPQEANGAASPLSSLPFQSEKDGRGAVGGSLRGGLQGTSATRGHGSTRSGTRYDTGTSCASAATAAVAAMSSGGPGSGSAGSPGGAGGGGAPCKALDVGMRYTAGSELEPLPPCLTERGLVDLLVGIVDVSSLPQGGGQGGGAGRGGQNGGRGAAARGGASSSSRAALHSGGLGGLQVTPAERERDADGAAAEWSVQFASIDNLRRICKFAPAVLLDGISALPSGSPTGGSGGGGSPLLSGAGGETTRAGGGGRREREKAGGVSGGSTGLLQLATKGVLRLCESLRSGLAKNALICLGELAAEYQRKMDFIVDAAVPLLLKKSGETAGFISEEAERTLRNLALGASEGKMIGAVATTAGETKNQTVKARAAKVLSLLVSERLSVGGRDDGGAGARRWNVLFDKQDSSQRQGAGSGWKEKDAQRLVLTLGILSLEASAECRASAKEGVQRILQALRSLRGPSEVDRALRRCLQGLSSQQQPGLGLGVGNGVTLSEHQVKKKETEPEKDNREETASTAEGETGPSTDQTANSPQSPLTAASVASPRGGVRRGEATGASPL
uniref:CLASP N-terminal domain-containing protein n=1 Tax=Chromera velia CCMP2878 TaxID=1169474 RepID=A0A0G4GIB7_9ALVE|eukprot:Cvel_22026.t1-p1 / transcript=Cvel_22026.t1 / gene=Cvel_22026 / organism=Chromera_velia_CCMP2878 / gene_product=hypothetical protein / transcript_product=hypothetical protein / location=Cvel_scaffold2125:14511-29162(+) / protein_length=2615 / sequence_SO=supercontig / SO=protein_coding / is_pseudo=false